MRREPLWTLGAALAVGAAWLLLELGFVLTENRAVDAGDALLHFGRALPWQLAAFAGLGGGVALAGRLSRSGRAFAVLAVATLLFVGSRLVEGLVRRDHLGAVDAVLRLGGLLAGTLVVFGGLSLLGRLLPARLRSRWWPAVALGWGVLLVPALHRSSALLALGRLPDAGMVFELPELVFAFALAATVLLTALSPLVWLAVASLMLAPPLAGIGRSRGSERVTATARDRPDVVLILIDTLRADHLPPDAEPDAFAPAFEAFAEESIRFRRAYSPGNQTLLAMPGVLTSLSPLSVGRSLAPGAHTLAEHLLDAGYATLAISGNPLVSARLGYDQGFQWFSDPNDWPSFMIGDLRRVLGVALPDLAYWAGVTSTEFYYRPVSEIRRRAEGLLARSPQPLFLYLHTMDMHGPYLPPAELLPDAYSQRDFLSYFSFLRLAETGSLGDGEHEPQIDNLRQRYAAEMRSTDAELGQLFEALREQGRFEESLIWVLSDHGESFGERGFAGHGGRNMTSSVLQVPLLLKPPRSFRLPLLDVEVPVSTYDVLPTTLGLLGLPQPDLRLGTDLSGMLRGASPHRDFTVVSQSASGHRRILSGFEGPWKLDIEFDSESGQIVETSLYNVLADPEERVDLKRAHPRVVAKLERGIRDYLAREKRAFYDTRRGEFDDETLERLQRLGYVE